jgi:uncharacterized protein (DUF1499 family)
MIRYLLVLPIIIVFLGCNRDPSSPDTWTGLEILPPCPDKPNCVSSLAEDPGRKVEPFPVYVSASESLHRLGKIVRSMPRTAIIQITEIKLQAEFRTRLGFVDDVLFAFSEDEKLIHVRSASRVGTWDLGVNRRRVERIREAYENR